MSGKDLEIIQTQIETAIMNEISSHDGHAVREKLQTLSTLLASCSICIVESKRIMLKKRGEWVRKHAEKISTYSPSIAKEFTNTAVVDEEILFTRCERNYSALVHSIDALRSILSCLKAEMTL